MSSSSNIATTTTATSTTPVSMEEGSTRHTGTRINNNNNNLDPFRRKKQARYQKHVSTRGGTTTAPLPATVSNSPTVLPVVEVISTPETPPKQQQKQQQQSSSLSNRRTRMKRRQLRTGEKKEGLVKKLLANKQLTIPIVAVPDDSTDSTHSTDSTKPPDPPTTVEATLSEEYQEFTIASPSEDPLDQEQDEDDDYNEFDEENVIDYIENIDYDPYNDDINVLNDRISLYEAVLKNSLMEALKDEEEHHGWDTRHVLTHPPVTPLLLEDNDEDAWDTSLPVTFPDCEEKKSIDEITETIEWDTTRIYFDSSNPTTTYYDGADDLFDLQSTFVNSEVAFSDVCISHVEQNLFDNEQQQEKQTNVPKEDEALLTRDNARSDVVQNEIPIDIDDHIIPQQERIDNYLRNNEDYLSSDDETAIKAVETDDNGDEDDDDDDDMVVHVQYVSHNAVANEQALDDIPIAVSEETEEEALYAYTSFEPAVRAARQSENSLKTGNEEIDDTGHEEIEMVHSKDNDNNNKKKKNVRSKIEVENLDMLVIQQQPSKDHSMFELSLDSLMGEGFLTGGSLAGSSIISRKTRDSPSRGLEAKDEVPTVKKPLPLIKPPPEEKLRKWEEQKLRPFKHLESMKEAKAIESVMSDAGSEPWSESSLPIDAMTRLDTKDSAIYAKLTVTKTDQHEVGSTNRKNAKAKWKESRKESDIPIDGIQMEPDEIESVTMETATEFATITNLVSDTIRVSVSGPPEIIRQPLKDNVSVTQQQETKWKDSIESQEVSFVNGLTAPILHPSFALNDGSRGSMGDAITNTESLKNSKIAAQVAVVSSQAERKFDIRFKMAKAAVNAEASEFAESVGKKILPNSSTSASFFSCGAGNSFLNVSAFDKSVDRVADNHPLESFSSSVHLSPGLRNGVGVEALSPSSPPETVAYPSEDDSHNTGVDLIGGAFSTWNNATYAKTSETGAVDLMDLCEKEMYNQAVDAAASAIATSKADARIPQLSETDLISWLESDVFNISVQESLIIPEDEPTLASILREKGKLETLCSFVTDRVNETIESGTNIYDQSAVTSPTGKQTKVVTFSTPDTSGLSSCVLAANFLSFLQRISKLTGAKSPFGNDNPFLIDIIGSTLAKGPTISVEVNTETMQDKIFGHELGDPVEIVHFFFVASNSARQMLGSYSREQFQSTPNPRSVAFPNVQQRNSYAGEPISPRRYHKPPAASPGPFEITFWSMPSVVLIVLGFLGDPVVVCRMKMVNQYCSRIITESEQTVMRDAVRLGGMSMNVRPAFWMWITLEKGGKMKGSPLHIATSDCDMFATGPSSACDGTTLEELEKMGREGKWHHVIGRDVARAFGNMPPHKTGARFRTDSIVRALITWGQGRLMKRGVKGGGEETPIPSFEGRRQRGKPRQSTARPPWEVGNHNSRDSGENQTPTETVSDWGGVSPVGSFSSSLGEDHAQKMSRQNSTLDKSYSPDGKKRSRAVEELALSGNALTNDMKQGLQNQLGFILHALAATHQDVGYCQGMDYVVAHLLRVLQDTVRWRAVKGTLPSVIVGAARVPHASITDASQIDDTTIDESMVVEESVFRVMDCFFTTYNLRHMYWPELRCLKTCCLVFERLIHLKLPVLADHFEHHELNVGLFALGWFQTLFLYLPSMPSATVCHMWDIWLVERSFKIFFRVGTAILFLSQPILLNHEMEGMMTYLNTFPDATLLNPDILIACALQIKVTNKMLMEIELQVTGGT